ncbi:unnamed protein product, partial [Iphiclides podalirius]
MLVGGVIKKVLAFGGVVTALRRQWSFPRSLRLSNNVRDVSIATKSQSSAADSAVSAITAARSKETCSYYVNVE